MAEREKKSEIREACNGEEEKKARIGRWNTRGRESYRLCDDGFERRERRWRTKVDAQFLLLIAREKERKRKSSSESE
jgi:hypothetical protein